jgi:hypothetical protein
MHRQTYGTIAHPSLRYNNPVSPAKMEEMIDLLPLEPSATVLDIGTGQAELLIRLVERYQVSALGLVPIYAVVCSEDEWDRFEWLNLHERYQSRQPDDPGLPALIAELDAWRDIYLRWGRNTLGFGLYLFQV